MEFGMWNAELKILRGRSEGGKMDEKKTNNIRTVKDLKVYRKAFDSAIVNISMKRLPRA